MQFKRVIISFLLIFSYSFGFAHSLIPHCDNLLNGNHIHNTAEKHKHQHNSSLEENHENHSHVSHGNHFDEGVYDLLMCLFSDLDHGDSECSMQHTATSEPSITYDSQEFAKVFSTFIALFAIVENKEEITISKVSDAIYASPEINALSLRGPPVIS
ncbi:MAG: hypothetical protein COA33_009655 [Fluviicola sp.]|nr:hypothetical protein [Fluviicola sp.]